jgi:NTP pyrophosphatase (non-canonical NTP hydrolase)
MEIKEMQRHHKHWVDHNFPNQKPHDALLGICEEAGELCHAHLKRDQGIRGMDPETYVEAASDALGDIFIYMLSYANANGFDLQDCIEATFLKVMDRDWVADPDGKSA